MCSYDTTTFSMAYAGEHRSSELQCVSCLPTAVPDEENSANAIARQSMFWFQVLP